MPRVKALNLADLKGVRAAQPQEGPQQASAGRPHARQGTGSGPAGQPQQHLFGLVIEGVAEQDNPGAGVVGGGFQGGVPGIPGRRLRPHPGGGNLDRPDLYRRESQVPQRRRGAGSDIGGTGLQLVVHNDGADGDGVAVHVPAAGEVGGDGGEGQRVRPAAAGDQDPFRVVRSGEGILQHLPRRADDGRQPAGPAPASGQSVGRLSVGELSAGTLFAGNGTRRHRT